MGKFWKGIIGKFLSIIGSSLVMCIYIVTHTSVAIATIETEERQDRIQTCALSLCAFYLAISFFQYHTVDCDFFVVKIFSYMREKLKIIFMKIYCLMKF